MQVFSNVHKWKSCQAASRLKKIHDMMLDEEVVGGDETTENINGVLKWLWTWRSERLTY